MAYYSLGKDYICLIDGSGARMLKNLYTESSNFQLKPSALTIRDRPKPCIEAAYDL